MESSKIFGGTEECNSCESGWTMYIGSPINGSDDDGGHSHGEDHSNDRGYDDDDDGDDMNYNHEDYSDDSMASDASSGPSNQGISHFRIGEDRKTESKCNSEKKVRKPMDKQNAESRRKNDKETKEFMAERSTNTAAKTGSKVRRNNWIGKRK